MRDFAIYILLVVSLTAALPQLSLADEDFSVVINGRTGEVLLRNDNSTSVNLDGYLLRSPQVNVFAPGGWDRLQDNPATPGWLATTGTANRLGEASLFSSSNLVGGGTLEIGSPYTPFVPAAFGELEPGLNTIDFTYSSTQSGASLVGDVEFIQRNTVVLMVDPSTGEASLENQSIFDIHIDSYLIRSAENVLSTSGWLPLQTSLGGPGGWTASTGVSNRLAEGNLFGSSPLTANGGSLAIGSPIDPALLDDEGDLELLFSLAGGGSFVGGVQFLAAAVTQVEGDYNEDGTVNAADYSVWRDRLGQSVALPNEVPGVTPGTVTQEDYDEWRSRFGNTAGSGAGTLGASQVPEPASYMLACLAAISLLSIRRKMRVLLPAGVRAVR